MTILQASREAQTPRLRLFWTSVAALSIVCIFILPFSVPPRIPTFSTSYTVGFNNRIAAVATVLISLAVAVYLWWRKAGAYVREASEPMPGWWLAAASTVSVAYTAYLGWRVVRADIFFGDAGYFMTQLAQWLHFHAKLYSELEFPYGPILFYWPVICTRVLGRVGVSPEAAYIVSLAVMQVAGLGVVFYVLRKLPLSRGMRAVALAGSTIATLTPVFGLNYTMFRFALPYAAILWIADCKGFWKQAMWCGLGGMLMLGVSVELAVAFSGGVAFYAIFCAITGERRWLLLSLVPMADFLLFAGLMGKDYFRMVSKVGEGEYNLIVDPAYAHIDILLIAAVALSPFAIAGYTRRYGRQAAGLVGMYGAALGMIPSALGSCDALHTFFSGLGVGLLSLLAVDGYKNLLPKVWVGMFLLWAINNPIEQVVLMRSSLHRVLVGGPADMEGFDMPRLEAVTAGEKIAAPILLPLSVQRELMRNGQYEQSFFCYMETVWDDESEEIKVAEMHRARYVLLPNMDYKWTVIVDNLPRTRMFRLGYAYPERHPMYEVGAIIQQDLSEHWVPVSTFGNYMLYRQR
jgi:hypothetical protein